MADSCCAVRPARAGWKIGVMLGLVVAGPEAEPRRARAEAPGLRLQAIGQQIPGGCKSLPELDARVLEEVKQLTGRPLHPSPASPLNPTRMPAEPLQVFGGYIEPLDDEAWRARLWLKEAGTARVAVRDAYYRNLERLTAELPQDAAALILLPDFTRAASALPQYCTAPGKPPQTPYPEDACDPFLPPPSCGVPFDCALPNQEPRCPPGPMCGVAGRPACPPPAKLCRVRDWRFGTGIAALVAGGVAVVIGGVIHSTATEYRPAAASASYVTGGVILGVGAGLVTHWGLHSKTAACR